MVAIQDGKYAHTALPDPALGPRKVDVPDDVQRRAVPAALQRQAGRPDAAGRPRLTASARAELASRRRSRQSSRPDRAADRRGRGRTCRRRRGRAAIRPVSSWAARALTGRTAPSCAARSRAIAEVLAVERDLEPERVVVVDHPAAAVGEDPALGRSAAERTDDLLDIEAGLDGQDDALRRRRGRCRPG